MKLLFILFALFSVSLFPMQPLVQEKGQKVPLVDHIDVFDIQMRPILYKNTICFSEFVEMFTQSNKALELETLAILQNPKVYGIAQLPHNIVFALVVGGAQKENDTILVTLHNFRKRQGFTKKYTNNKSFKTFRLRCSHTQNSIDIDLKAIASIKKLYSICRISFTCNPNKLAFEDVTNHTMTEMEYALQLLPESDSITK